MHSFLLCQPMLEVLTVTPLAGVTGHPAHSKSSVSLSLLALALQGGRGPGSANSPQIQGLDVTPPAAKGGNCGGSMRCPHPSVAKGHT